MKLRNIVICLSALILLAVAAIFLFKQNETSRVDEPIRTQFNASCMVKSSQRGMGSGVLLNTGYILTAAHVVDANNDRRLTIDEMDVSTIFFGDNKQEVHKGRVAYFSKKYDFALIDVDLPDSYQGVDVAKYLPDVGAEIYAIGMTAGSPTRVAGGYVSEPYGGRDRMSCYISQGDSGGGVFKKSTGELIGISNAFAIQREHIYLRIPIPSDNGFMLVQVVLPIKHNLNAVSAYVSVDKVRRDLESKNIGLLLNKKEQLGFIQQMKSPWIFGVVKTIVQCLLVFLCVWTFRKQLFS